MLTRTICILLLSVGMLLGGCTSSSEPSTVKDVLESPLASPLSTSAVSVPTPTPAPGLGSVQGALFTRENGTEVPVRRGLLFLAPTVKNTEGVEAAAALDRTASPYTHTDESGNFKFHNVPPGRYALVFDLLPQAFLLNSPTDGGNLVIVVSPDQVTDIGRLVYDQLPTTP